MAQLQAYVAVRHKWQSWQKGVTNVVTALSCDNTEFRVIVNRDRDRSGSFFYTIKVEEHRFYDEGMGYYITTPLFSLRLDSEGEEVEV